MPAFGGVDAQEVESVHVQSAPIHMALGRQGSAVACPDASIDGIHILLDQFMVKAHTPDRLLLSTHDIWQAQHAYRTQVTDHASRPASATPTLPQGYAGLEGPMC